MEEQARTQPILILPAGYTRTVGRDAQRMNIMAARIVAETIRTTLGPKGMDKMLVDSLGDITITNDGATILKEMEVEHPAAKMIVEVAKTQEEEVGDGTTTAVVLAGELLKNAEVLLDQEVHPTIIANGYKIAAEKAEEILSRIAIKVDEKNEEKYLRKVVETAIRGKASELVSQKLTDILVKAALQVKEERDGKFTIDKDNIKIQKRMGGGTEDTELIDGIVIDKERVHEGMPKIVYNAKIALLDVPLEIEKTEIDAQIRIETPEQMQLFLKQEENMLREMVEKIKKSGANVVFCQKGIDDVAQHFLAKEGIFAVRRVSESDMKRLARATGAKIVSSLDDLSEKDLGFAQIVEERKIAGEAYTFVMKCKNPKAVTIFIRGGTEHVVDEIERAVDDAIGNMKAVIETRQVVAGGGAPESEVAKELRKYAEKLSGREQLAVRAFADALEIIPRTLAENAGLDPIDIMAELRAQHEQGKIWSGVNVNEGKVSDMLKQEVIEPLKIKVQAIKSAAEAAIMILRIDDVIAAGKVKETKPSKPETSEESYE